MMFKYTSLVDIPSLFKYVDHHKQNFLDRLIDIMLQMKIWELSVSLWVCIKTGIAMLASLSSMDTRSRDKDSPEV